jgi:outer membrane protein OmpA-like peptidoglycan-associated protein
MKSLQRTIGLILILLAIASACLAADDFNRTMTIRVGRTDSECDIESPGKTLFMFGGSYELWYKEVVSVGPYVYFSQLHGGPHDHTAADPNFRSYVAGLDLKARFRPKWDWINVRMPGFFISRIAPYVNGGFGGIVFEPKRRDAPDIPGDYKKSATTFPVVGAGVTLFSKLGVTGDIGVDYHLAKTDYLDGTSDSQVPSTIDGKKGNDSFYTYFIALTIGSAKAVVAEVVLPPEPEPEPIVVPAPKPAPIIVPEPEPEPEPELNVTPSIHNVTPPSGTTSYEVFSNVRWNVVETEDWFRVSPASGINNGKFDVIYDSNQNTTPRTGQIIVMGGGLTRNVSIVQSAPEVVFRKDISLTIKGVTFKTNSAELTAAATVELDKVVKALQEFPEVTLDIQGHTDSDGAEAANMDLSKRRTASVKAYLVSKGIDAGRLTTSWFGESKPIEPNTTPAGKAKNRRIEFIRTD